ncbi:MAG: T9SS type A sorting domain-containing protein [Bacteroidetes bacterium]|nr:T9SS type A sorting domain-containing protein [Bacteroidota bacterium]
MKTIYTFIFAAILLTQSAVAQCSGTAMVLNSASGSLTDGSGSSDYIDNLDCFWLISPAGAGTISLTFTALDLELYQPSDKVRIYDGSDTLAALIATVTDVTFPGTITSTGGAMYIRFTTDHSYEGAGWAASYTSTTAPPVFCNGNTTLTASSGAFSDGSSSSNYGNNANCTWLIQPPAATSITLTFAAFNTEAGQDFIKVYDYSSSPPTLIGSYSGGTIPSPVVLSSGGAMLVEFTTNNSITDLGWSASYTSTIAPPEYCSGSTTLTAASGSFNDGSGTDNYSDGANCTWLIQPANTSSITLTFSDFGTQGGMDFVKVYDNSTSPASQIGSYSGNSVPSSLTLPGSAMKVVFTSNGSVTDVGWSASYTSVSTVGIADNELNKAISIYPNPFHQTATLKFSVPEVEACEFILYDVLGKSLIKMVIPAFTTSVVIDAKSLPNGMYFYSLSENNMLIHTGKVIIQ